MQTRLPNLARAWRTGGLVQQPRGGGDRAAGGGAHHLARHYHPGQEGDAHTAGQFARSQLYRPPRSAA